MTFTWQDRRWHVRLYLWAEPIVAEFFEKRSITEYHNDSVSTNLCPYMRTILVWFPLAILMNGLALLAALTAFFLVPVSLIGIKAYAITLGCIFTWLVVLVAVAWWRVMDRKLDDDYRKIFGEDRDDTPTLHGALAVYAGKLHDGICPGITITRTKDGDQ